MIDWNSIESLLAKEEGKTIEFKENCRSLSRIVQSVVAFANTAGGVLVIGIRDRTKDVVGLPDPLADEEKLANAFADSIQPLLIPDIQISAWRDRELIIVSIPHTPGPYYVKSEGIEKGVYIRLGSTNRRAGPEIIEEIRRLSRNTFFDEQPCTEVNSEAIDFRAASEFFAEVSRSLNEARMTTLGLLVNRGGKNIPTRGAILLFGKNGDERKSLRTTQNALLGAQFWKGEKRLYQERHLLPGSRNDFSLRFQHLTNSGTSSKRKSDGWGRCPSKNIFSKKSGLTSSVVPRVV